MASAWTEAVLESIDVGTGERALKRVAGGDLQGMLLRAEGMFGRPVRLHDGSLLFMQASTVEAPAEGTRITVHGPDKVSIEGIRVVVDKVHHVRMLKDDFLK